MPASWTCNTAACRKDRDGPGCRIRHFPGRAASCLAWISTNAQEWSPTPRSFLGSFLFSGGIGEQAIPSCLTVKSKKTSLEMTLRVKGLTMKVCQPGVVGLSYEWGGEWRQENGLEV